LVCTRVAYSVPEVRKLVAKRWLPTPLILFASIPPCSFDLLQGGLVPSKISGVGTNFGLLVHVLPWPNKRLLYKPSIIFELN
jgi:hypothetical protein